MPFVTGFLRRISRPGRPDIGLPGPEEPVDPDWGIEEGDGDRPPLRPLPNPPPGVWPGPTIAHPIQPVPPGDETPPGTLWPSPGTPEHPIASHKLWIVAWIPGVGYRYVCVDPSLVPRPVAGPARRA